MTICTTSTIADCRILLTGKGSSKKLRHAAICVVNKKVCIGSNTLTSKVPIIVNKIITAMVDTIGPIELSEKQERVIEREALVIKAR